MNIKNRNLEVGREKALYRLSENRGLKKRCLGLLQIKTRK